MKFAKFLRTPFLQNTSGRLLPEINLSSQKNKWVFSSKEFLIISQSFLSFLFEKVITYTIIVLPRKIFQQISEVLCNRVWLFICYKTKLKKKFFFWKKICFFTNYTFAEKNNFIWKKKFILIFFYWKNFFYRKWKKKYISFEKYFFIQNIYIYSAKKMLLIIKNILVKTLWWTQ